MSISNNMAYAEDYSISQLHSLIGDWARTNAYADFLLSGVCSGKTVVDCGAGSGVCTYLALRGGARRVIACDISSEICDYLESVFEQDYRVSVCQLDLCNQQIPEGDLYIHELIGNALYGEGINEIFANMRSQGIGNIYPRYARVTNGYVTPGKPKPSDNMDYMLRSEVIDFIQYNEHYEWSNSLIHDWPDLDWNFALPPENNPWLWLLDLRQPVPDRVKDQLHPGDVIWEVGFDNQFKNSYTNVNPECNNWNTRTPYIEFIKCCNFN